MNPHAPLRGRCRCASACIRDVGRYGVAGSMEERMGKEWEREEEEEKTGGEKERTRERTRECARGERAMMGGRRKEGFTHTNGIRLASGARIATLTIALVCGGPGSSCPRPHSSRSVIGLPPFGARYVEDGTRACACVCRYDAKGRFTHIDEKLFPTDTRMRFASMCATRGGPGSSCLLMHSLRYHLPGKISHHRGQATPRTNW